MLTFLRGHPYLRLVKKCAERRESGNYYSVVFIVFTFFARFLLFDLIKSVLCILREKNWENYFSEKGSSMRIHELGVLN